MGRFKTAKKTPTPLDNAEIAKATTQVEYTQDYDTASIWSIVKCMQEFTCCLLAEEAASPAFDKDDPMAMRFVTAAANLRSHVFGIEPLQSVYSAKGIAGNIIPAIATTNAIVAGLQVLQAFHILQTQLESTNGDKKTVDGSTSVVVGGCVSIPPCRTQQVGTSWILHSLQQTGQAESKVLCLSQRHHSLDAQCRKVESTTVLDRHCQEQAWI